MEDGDIKVAILGAGLSGLTCAITLEKHGINPVIFEKRRQAGDRFVNGEILLSLLSQPVDDVIAYFADNYQIYLQPVSHIRSLILHSEHAKAVINGKLGFCNIRGRHEKSFENQLARQVKSEIVYNSEYTYEQLVHDYTHVVLATGDAAYALALRNYKQDFTTLLNGYTVAGDFDRYTVRAWLNNQFAPYGYGYFIPLSEKEANLVLWHPEYSIHQKQDQNLLLTQFFKQAQKDLDQELRIIDHFEVQHYSIGLCRYPRIGNTYYTGNCFGAIDPYLGFGQFISILTGVYAALDICGIAKYEELTKPLRQNHENSLVLRRAWELFDNRRFDWMVRFFGSGIGKKIFTSQKYDAVKIASFLARPWVRLLRLSRGLRASD
ncbi:MAG: FAD-dependent oxidoreductase [Bacteroidota bacterium]